MRDYRADTLHKLFPSVNTEVRNGSVTQDAAVRVITTAIERYYPGAVHALVCGSILDGRYRAYSDLDVVVTLREQFNYERQCVIFEGYPIDFQALNVDGIDQFVVNSRRRGIGFTLRALSASEILRDRDGRARQLQAWMTTQYAAGPMASTPETISLLRTAIIDTIADLCTVEDRREMIAIGLSIFTFLMNLMLPKKTGWLETGKYIPRDLDRVGTEYFDSIEAAYRDLLGGDAQRLIELATSILSEWGPVVWNGPPQRAISR